MHTSWPADAEVSEEVIVIHNCLHQHGVPTFTIVIVCMIHGRCICDPSIRPADCGMPNFSLNPLTTSFKPSPDGNRMYIGRSFRTIALHVSLTITQTVQWAIPKRWATLQYAAGVAKTQKWWQPDTLWTQTFLCKCSSSVFVASAGHTDTGRYHSSF